MATQVNTDPELIARVKSRSVRAPERDVPPDLECWREGSSNEHYFLRGAYLHTLAWIPSPS